LAAITEKMWKAPTSPHVYFIAVLSNTNHWFLVRACKWVEQKPTWPMASRHNAHNIYFCSQSIVYNINKYINQPKRYTLVFQKSSTPSSYQR